MYILWKKINNKLNIIIILCMSKLIHKKFNNWKISKPTSTCCLLGNAISWTSSTWIFTTLINIPVHIHDKICVFWIKYIRTDGTQYMYSFRNLRSNFWLFLAVCEDQWYTQKVYEGIFTFWKSVVENLIYFFSKHFKCVLLWFRFPIQSNISTWLAKSTWVDSRIGVYSTHLYNIWMYL